MVDTGTNRSQGVGVATIAEKSKNNASCGEKSDRTRAFTGEGLK